MHPPPKTNSLKTQSRTNSVHNFILIILYRLVLYWTIYIYSHLERYTFQTKFYRYLF